MKLLLKAAVFPLLFAAILGLASCADDDVVNTQANNLEMSYVASADTTDSGVLVLDTVKILIKDIKLNVASTSDSTNFKTGPYVLYLDFNTGVNTFGSALIPAGTYDKVQFEVHKLNQNEPVPDPEFIDSINSYSVVAKGTYNGVRFVYKSDKSATQKLSFPNSLVVTETLSNITLSVQPYIWFIDANNQYMDPNDPNNRNNIDNNIKDNVNENFKAFKDNDKNGVPD